jgi:hypothetical protein
MTSRNRYFLIGALLVLVVGLGVGLVAYRNGALPGLGAGPGGPAELRDLPANATLVAYADVHSVMQSRFRQEMLRFEPDEAGRRSFQEKTGIDVERDIDHVVACLTPAGDPHDSTGLVLARGTFDQQKIAALIQGQGGRTEDYDGHRIFVHDPEGGHGQALALAFVEPGLVAVGSLPLVKASLDLRSGHGANITSNDDLMKLIRENDHGTAWAVGRFDELRARTQLPEQVARQIPPITWFSVDGHIDDGVSGTVKAETRDQQSADNLRQVVQGFVALARMQVSSQPDLQSVLQSVQLGGAGRTVSLSFAVPAQVLDRLPGHAPGANDGRRPPR